MLLKPFRSLLLVMLLGSAVSPVLAANEANTAELSATITGTIKDTTGAVLPGAQIVLAPSGATVSSDSQGNFSIRDVRPGTYIATITYVGFGKFTSTVNVIPGQPIVLNAVLSVDKNTQSVTVSGNLSGDAAAINEQRTSENILNVETDTTIQSLPNANIADALGRLPGVTLQRNEGEGQYVQIRGTEPRLSNTTIDGVIVPGPDPAVRQVDLDTIPSSIVGSVAINKTLSANQDGDAIGGSVDIRLKQATSDKPYFSVEGMGGFTPIDNTRKVFSINSAAGMRFGQSTPQGKRFGLMLGYSYDYNGRGIDDVEPSPDLNPDGSVLYDSIHENEYLYDRTRYGLAGALDYKLSPTSDLYAHGLFSNFRDYGQKYEYEYKNKINGDGNPAGKASYHTSVRRPNLQIASLALGGNHVFNHSFLHYQIAAAHSRFGGAAGNPGADFGSTAAHPDCAYSAATTVSIYRPQFTCINPTDAATDPTQYQLQDINLTSGQASQLNLQAGASAGFDYHLGSHASTLEFGGQFRNEHKGQDAYSPTYDNNNNPDILPFESQFLSTYTNPHFYGGSYYLPRVTDFATITAYLAANPSVVPLDEAATHQASDAANYNLQERVGAFYLMNTLALSPRLHLQTGLRVETTNTSDTGYLVTTNADGSYGGTTPQTGSGSYINPLPSVQLRYNLDPSSDIRAVYGRGISRPDPYQLVPYIVFTQGGASNGNDLVQIGNPALVAEHANDFDVLYERYLPAVGMIEAGYFYKQITKPLYLEQSIIPQTGSPLSQSYAGDEVQQEVDGDHAYVQGIELAYQQHLTALPGVLRYARISGNFTYTSSKNYNLVGRTDTPQLVGQAPYSWNIGPAYETKRALVSVGISHNGANIYAYQYQNTGDNYQANVAAGNLPCFPNGTDATFNTPSSPCGDNYFYSHTQIDAQASYYLTKGITVIASGQNINNEVFGFYNGSPKYMAQREYYKPTYSFGLKWNLLRSKQ
jgi:TonB-dependent receptor